MKILFFTVTLLLYTSYSSNAFSEETKGQKFDKKVQAVVDEAVEGGKRVVRQMKKSTNSQTDEEVEAESKKKVPKE